MKIKMKNNIKKRNNKMKYILYILLLFSIALNVYTNKDKIIESSINVENILI